MKIEVCMKCPDCLDDAINDCVDNEEEREKIKELAGRWFKYGEMVTLMIDTENETCVVRTAR